MQRKAMFVVGRFNDVKFLNTNYSIFLILLLIHIQLYTIYWMHKFFY